MRPRPLNNEIMTFKDLLDHCTVDSAYSRRQLLSSLISCGLPVDSMGVPWRQPHCRSGLATCPLWEPSPSHPVVSRGFSVCFLYMCVCVYCFFCVFCVIFVFRRYDIPLTFSFSEIRFA